MTSTLNYERFYRGVWWGCGHWHSETAISDHPEDCDFCAQHPNAVRPVDRTKRGAVVIEAVAETIEAVQAA